MHKVLTVFIALAVVTGVVVIWQPAAATAAAPVMTAARPHPTARVCPDNGKLLACFAIRQTDTVQLNVSANTAPADLVPLTCAAPTT